MCAHTCTYVHTTLLTRTHTHTHTHSLTRTQFNTANSSSHSSAHTLQPSLYNSATMPRPSLADDPTVQQRARASSNSMTQIPQYASFQQQHLPAGMLAQSQSAQLPPSLPIYASPHLSHLHPNFESGRNSSPGPSPLGRVQQESSVTNHAHSDPQAPDYLVQQQMGTMKRIPI